MLADVVEKIEVKAVKADHAGQTNTEFGIRRLVPGSTATTKTVNRPSRFYWFLSET